MRSMTVTVLDVEREIAPVVARLPPVEAVEDEQQPHRTDAAPFPRRGAPGTGPDRPCEASRADPAGRRCRAVLHRQRHGACPFRDVQATVHRVDPGLGATRQRCNRTRSTFGVRRSASMAVGRARTVPVAGRPCDRKRPPECRSRPAGRAWLRFAGGLRCRTAGTAGSRRLDTLPIRAPQPGQRCSASAKTLMKGQLYAEEDS